MSPLGGRSPHGPSPATEPAARLGRGLTTLLLAILVLSAAPGLARAQTATPSAALPDLAESPDPIEAGLVSPDEVAAVARELNCPLCQGYNLQDCPLTVCAQMRRLIAQQLAEGMTPQAVMDGFVADYGPQVLNAPPTEGAWLITWLTPGLLLILAAGLLLGRGAWRRERSAAPRAEQPASAKAHGPEAGGDVDPGLEDYARRFEALARDAER